MRDFGGHVEGRPRRAGRVRGREGKEDWLLGIGGRIAHAKDAKVGKESRYGDVRMRKCGFELGNLGSGGISEVA